MNAEQIEALVAVIGLLFSLLTWLWRTSASTTKAHLSLGVVVSDVGGLKNEVQHLRDSDIRKDTLIQVMSGQLGEIKSKLEQFSSIAADVASTKTDMNATKLFIAQVAQQVVPRQEMQAKFDAVNERFRALEDRK